MAALLAVAMMLQMLPMLAFADDAAGTEVAWNENKNNKRLKSCKFIKMMAFITDFPPKFQHAHHMRIRILFQYLTSHCKSDTQKIIDCL